MEKQEVVIHDNDILQDLREKRTALRGKYSSSDLFKNQTLLGTYLQKKYPDYLNYRLYYFIIGSTPPEPEDITKYDFPGDDSIEKIINKGEFPKMEFEGDEVIKL